MKAIIDWLTGIEEAAGRFYRKAQRLFPDDAGLSELLKALADDEKLHYDLMIRASNLPEEEMAPPAYITDDAETRRGIEAYLSMCLKRLEEGTLTKEELVDFMVTIEVSEFNDLFLHVIKTLTDRLVTPVPVDDNIAEHKARIERFIAARPEFSRFADAVRRIPDAQREHILVVDDEHGMIEAFRTFLDRDGAIDSASNGREALAKLSRRKYSVIVSDVDMPVMDGVEFFKEAVKKHRYAKGSFIFMTGDASDERLRFFMENGLKCLIKPFSLKEIRHEVRSALGR